MTLQEGTQAIKHLFGSSPRAATTETCRIAACCHWLVRLVASLRPLPRIQVRSGVAGNVEEVVNALLWIFLRNLEGCIVPSVIHIM